MSDRNRAIDALIAEHAMGFSGVQNGPDGPEMIVERCVGDLVVFFAPVPRYSSDPSASKQLRDRMRELGWSYEIGFARGYGYAAEFLMLPKSSGEAGADTEELAVALAALSAIGIEVPC